MDLYRISDQGEIILLTATKSSKWKELTAISKTSVCIAHQDYGQILAEGDVLLKTTRNDPESVSEYWTNFGELFI